MLTLAEFEESLYELRRNAEFAAHEIASPSDSKLFSEVADVCESCLRISYHGALTRIAILEREKAEWSKIAITEPSEHSIFESDTLNRAMTRLILLEDVITNRLAIIADLQTQLELCESRIFNIYANANS